MSYLRSIYYSPDVTTNGGAGVVGTPDDSTGSAAPAAAKTEAEEGSTPTLTQAEVDRIVKDRLARAEAKLRKELLAQQNTAAEEKLAEAAEWQTLADKRKKALEDQDERIKELEAEAAKTAVYAEALEGYSSALSAGLPPEILDLIGKLDVAARLAWLTANAGKFAPNGSQDAKPATRALPATPKPSGSVELSTDERRSSAARTF